MRLLKEELASSERLVGVKRLCLIFIAGFVVSIQSSSQSATVEASSATQIGDLEQSLCKQAAASNGMAGASLAEYPGHYTQLIFRDKSGEVEIHQQFDEIMIVISGNAMVKTGGTPENLRTVKPGELRGTATRGGTSTAMEKGNLVHIPATTPHQVIVPAGGFVTYIDVKIAHSGS